MTNSRTVLSIILVCALLSGATGSIAGAQEAEGTVRARPNAAGRFIRDLFNPRDAALRASQERFRKPLDECWDEGDAGRVDSALVASERAIAAAEVEYRNRRGVFRPGFISLDRGEGAQLAFADAWLAEWQAEALRCAAAALMQSRASVQVNLAAQKFDAALEAANRMRDAQARSRVANGAATPEIAPSHTFSEVDGLPILFDRNRILLRARIQADRAQAHAILGNWTMTLAATDDVFVTADNLQDAPKFLQGDNDEIDNVAIDLVQQAAPLAAYALGVSGDFTGAMTRLESGRAYRLFRRIARQRLVAARAGGAYEACRVRWGEAPNYDWICLQNLEARTRAEIRAPLADQLAAALTTVSAIIVPSSACGAGQVLVAYRTSDGVQVDGVGVPDFTCSAIDELLYGSGLDALGMESRRTGWRRAYDGANRPDATEADRARWRDSIPTITDRMWPVFGRAVAEALRRAHVQPGDRILVLLPGALAPLPLGLMRSTHPARLLIDDYEVVQAPSLFAYTHAMQTPVRSRRALIVANPTQSLPSADAEAAAMVRWFPDSEQLGSDARLSTVRTLLPGASIWHFATHARFDWQHPDQSVLMLGGGDRLLLSDLNAMSLPSAPQLVFLSACETGLSATMSADEFIGLPAAFLELGAKNVIATLWSVSDVSSALISMKFYELYAGKGHRPSQALRSAQLWLRTVSASDLKLFLKSDAAWGLSEAQVVGLSAEIDSLEPAAAPFAHPYYWAGYVAMGP